MLLTETCSSFFYLTSQRVRKKELRRGCTHPLAVTINHETLWTFLNCLFNSRFHQQSRNRLILVVHVITVGLEIQSKH